MSRKLKVSVMACLAIMLFSAARTTAIRQAAGDFLIFRENPRPSDAIVVLGGDFWGPRVVHGAELGMSRYAPFVMISGPPYRDRPESELAIEFLEGRGYPRKLFVSFAHRALSTPDEVLVLCEELHRLSVRSIILVTDPYHSRRSRITFSLLCSDIGVISAPATQSNYQPLAWWSRPQDVEIVRHEWTRIAGMFVLAPVYNLRFWYSKAFSGH